jgi:cytochrome c oxidase subunit II
MPGSRLVPVLLGLFGAVVLAAPLVLGLGAIPGVAPPDSITKSGDTINFVYWVVFVMAAIVFLVIELALLWFIFRFQHSRAGHEHDLEGPQIHGNTRIEIIWTAIPAVLLLGLAIFTFSQVPDVQANPSAGEDVVTIDVTAHQFYWEYRYENGALSFDDLYIPVGKAVQLVIRSEDVDHSWWAPELTGKRDAIPGKTNTLNFTARETGDFDSGVCGEFCGIQHAHMTFQVHVLSEPDYAAWLEDNAPGTDAEAVGQDEWTASCAKCHGLDGQGGIGPAIAGNAILSDPKALKQLLYNGQDTPGLDNYMPPTGKGWTDEQIAALIAYLKSNPTLAGASGGG